MKGAVPCGKVKWQWEITSFEKISTIGRFGDSWIQGVFTMGCELLDENWVDKRIELPDLSKMCDRCGLPPEVARYRIATRAVSGLPRNLVCRTEGDESEWWGCVFQNPSEQGKVLFSWFPLKFEEGDGATGPSKIPMARSSQLLGDDQVLLDQYGKHGLLKVSLKSTHGSKPSSIL